MNRVARWLPSLVVTALAVLSSRAPVHATVLLSLAAAVLVAGPRVTLAHATQRVALTLAGIAGTALGLLAVPAAEGARLTGPPAGIATAFVCVTLMRGLLVDPEGGARVDMAFGMLALLSAGYVRATAAFPWCVWAFVLTSLVALRVEDGGRPAVRRLPSRRLQATAAMLVASVVVGIAAAKGVHRLHTWVLLRAMKAFDDTATSGFDDPFDLGAMESLQQSEELVLRIDGPAPDRLRGAVFDRYERGHWRSSRGPAHRVVRVAQGPWTGPDALRMERVGGLGGWYFAPLNTAGLATEAGSVRVDPLGVVRSIPGDRGELSWVRLGPRSALAPTAPTPVDLGVPEHLRARLTEIAAQFVGAPATANVRMDRIELALRTRYRYALRFQRAPRRDPVLDFLDVHREGHCEYFASALALLGRATGVPTRVVSGYRVAERNPINGQYLVREKNAHAWVEAWVGDRWQTYDATPSRALPQNERHESSAWNALTDALAERTARTRAWFAARSSTELLLVAAALLVGWLAWRAWQARRESSEARAQGWSAERPPTWWESFQGVMASRGVGRGDDETLTAWAERVSSSDALPTAVRGDVGRAVRDYAAWRYGAEGDPAAIERAVRDVTVRARGL